MKKRGKRVQMTEDKNKEKTPEVMEQEDKAPEAKENEENVTIPKSEYDELLKAKKAQQDLLYVYAEFDNFKKRHAKDVQQQVTFANEKIIKDVLPIIDNLCRAKDHASDCEGTTEQQFSKFLEGLDMILKQLMGVLKKFGVEEVNSLGEKFDPNFHEAMEQTESDKHEDGTVVNEYQKGYMLHGRLIRPSKVSIALKKKKED
jgi:molecular chaperone GrpE